MDSCKRCNKTWYNCSCYQVTNDKQSEQIKGLQLSKIDCHRYGIGHGCDEECPVYAEGNCEIQEENKINFEKKVK